MNVAKEGRWKENKTYLALAVRPKVSDHADDVVESRVCALVDEDRTQRTQWVDDQTSFDGPVQTATCKQRQRPLPRKPDEAENHVDNLQDGEGLDSAIEVLGGKVPEDFGPEEAFECSSYLIWLYRISHYAQCCWFVGKLTRSSREDDEARPVVLD